MTIQNCWFYFRQI